jgi:hypothetical protein
MVLIFFIIWIYYSRLVIWAYLKLSVRLISGGVRGTLPWMAPELLNGSSSLVSEKVT